VAAGAVEFVVEGDAGGEGGEALADAGAEAVESVGGVAFEGREVFEGPEDALDATGVCGCHSQPTTTTTAELLISPSALGGSPHASSDPTASGQSDISGAHIPGHEKRCAPECTDRPNCHPVHRDIVQCVREVKAA
jgi:hypothetical protein